MKCPHKLREDFPLPIPDRIAALPVDARGYPVPFFVQWLLHIGETSVAASPNVEGAEPDFRITNPVHLKACVTESLCWVCGQRLGVHRAYVIGPMCAINHNSAEPPSHVECAEWSARACPFLTKPNMKRREDELSLASKQNVAGIMIERNPGVTLVWIVRNHLKIWRDGLGGILFDIGDPERVHWYREGRTATLEECIESINSGIENLLAVCEGPEERNEVMERRDRLVASLKGAKPGYGQPGVIKEGPTVEQVKEEIERSME